MTKKAVPKIDSYFTTRVFGVRNTRDGKVIEPTPQQRIELIYPDLNVSLTTLNQARFDFSTQPLLSLRGRSDVPVVSFTVF